MRIETEEDAKENIEFLMGQYDGEEGPFVYPVLLKSGENIGYVQLVPCDEGWEVGYHIGKKYTKNGYAAEAVKAFLPYVMDERKIDCVAGICLYDNVASRMVMEKCNFIKEYEGKGMYQGEEREISKYVYKK